MSEEKKMSPFRFPGAAGSAKESSLTNRRELLKAGAIGSAAIVAASAVNTLPASAATGVPARKAAAAESSLATFGPFAFAASNSATFLASPFLTVLSAQIMPPGGKDLFIGFTAVTSLVAFVNQFKFFFGGANFTFNGAGIQVRARLDGTPIQVPPPPRPGSSIILLDNQFQTLDSILFDGFLFSQEFISRSATGTRGFNWIAKDVGVGVHMVDVQASFVADAAAFSFAAAFAMTGAGAAMSNRTLTIEEASL